jgi:small subunit ribosomal protein S8
MMTDPIADMLTRIRNAIQSQKEMVEVPFSKVKLGILKILQQEGYVRSAQVAMDGQKGKIQVALRYGSKKEPVITDLNRVSRPGRRVFVGYNDIKPVFGGLGVSVLSTSKGLMTDKQAKESKMGGELLFTVW